MSADDYRRVAAIEFEGADGFALSLTDDIHDLSSEGGKRVDDDELPPDPDLSGMNEMQRESWAAEDGITRFERRRRLGLVIAYEQEHGPDRREAAAERSGWTEVDLGPVLDGIEAGTLKLPVPTVGMLADGSAGLFYEGRVNGLAGESGGGKSWIALAVGIEQMQRGRHFYYLDFEDSPALAVLRLVTVLGADPSLVRRHFHYLHPRHHDEDGIAALVEQVASTPGALVVIDSTGESIASASLNQNHDEDVAAWFARLADPLAEAGGATVLLLDHMTKSEDGGLWPIGSQRKRAAITGAQYVAEVAQPFTKSSDGMVVLRVAKDRNGQHEARSVASYVQFTHPVESVTTDADGTTTVELGESLTITLGLGKSADQINADRAAKVAAALDANVSDLDQLNPPPKSQRDVMDRMGWGSRKAMDALREWRARQAGGGATRATP